MAHIAERELQFHLSFAQLSVPGELAQPVQLPGHPAQDLLQKVFAEVPVPHLQIDVFLNDRMAGLAEDGGQGWEAEIGFGGKPIRREEQQHFQLPTAGSVELLAI